MEKEQAGQQCHDLQQELAMEGEHHQEMSEEIKRLKKELNTRYIEGVVWPNSYDKTEATLARGKLKWASVIS